MTLREDEVGQVVAALPLIIEGLRQWTFGEDGVLVTAGGPRSGLRLIAGIHPRRGAKYRATVTGPDAAPGGDSPATTFEAELQADDNRRFALRCEAADDQTEFMVEVIDPRQPTALRCAGSAQSLTQGWWGGRSTWQADLTLPIEVSHGHRIPAAATVDHRRFRAQADVRVKAGTPGDLVFVLTIHARGRGILRLLSALVGPFARRPMQRALDGWMRRTQLTLADLTLLSGDGTNRSCSARQVADVVLARSLAHIAD